MLANLVEITNWAICWVDSGSWYIEPVRWGSINYRAKLVAPHDDGSDWLTFGVDMFIPSVLCGSTEFTYHMIKSNFVQKNQQTTKLTILIIFRFA